LRKQRKEGKEAKGGFGVMKQMMKVTEEAQGRGEARRLGGRGSQGKKWEEEEWMMEGEEAWKGRKPGVEEMEAKEGDHGSPRLRR
jgi:hypothetical protein